MDTARGEGGSPHYWPVPRRVVALLAVSLAVSFALVNLASYAYSRVGLDPGWAFVVLVSSIVGSRFNIPVAQMSGETTIEPMLVRAWGTWYVVPRTIRHGKKIVAINVGGAVIPTLLSGYLIVHAALGWVALPAVAIVAIMTHAVARVIPGVGVVVPTFIPPITAALTAIAFGVGPVAALAYVAGTLGTLVGADLLNLPRARHLDAPILSIGGAGTFDGIFVTGIVAVLLAII